MKRFLLGFIVAVTAMVMMTVGVLADTATVNGITWTYTVSGGKASISDIPKKTTGAITIPSSLFGYPVTRIGDEAFWNCDGLTSVTIPDSVTSIGDYAFAWCEGLTSITIPNSVTSIGDRAFYGCSSLIKFIVDSNNQIYKSVNNLLLTKDGKILIHGVNGDVVIPQGVTSIGDYAFSSYSGLTSVIIPDSVTSIGYYAFDGCRGLIKFIVDSNNQIFKSANNLLLTKDGKILIYGVNGDVVIPQGVTSIAARAFYEFSGLTSVTIGNSVTSIGGYAFYDCDGFTSITIPNSVTSIGERAFYSCDGLTSVTIGNSVMSIGERAFEYCENLKDIYFLCDAPRIGDYVFDRIAYNYVIWIKKGTYGWDGNYTSTALPENWRGYRSLGYLSTYTVYYYANGGSGTMSAQSMTYNNTAYLKNNAFNRTGYTFQGWAKSKTGAVAYKDGASVKNLASSGTVTLYAVWKPNTYKVAFNANGGSGTMAVQTMGYDTLTKLRANAFKRTGYTFQGWAKSKTGTVAYKNGASVKNLASSGTVTLYAVWKPNTYKVAFYANGGTGSMSAQSMTYNKAAYLKNNAFKRSGYTFLGWAKSPTGAVAYKNAAAVKNLRLTAGTVTLYAKWAKTKYKIAFYANGGTGSMSAQSMTYNKAAYLKKNTFKRTGYTFQGWAKTKTGSVVYTNGKAVKNLTATGGTVKLYAKWKPISYKVVFYGYGGMGSMSAQTIPVNKAAYLKKNAFKRTGYTFAGWAKSAALAKKGKIAYKNRQVVKNLLKKSGTVKLIAVWKPITYKVAFYPNGASGKAIVQTMTYNKAAYLKKNIYKRSGYIFLGWAKTKNGAVAYKNAQAVKNLRSTTGTIALYAVWAKTTYKVAFYANGGSGSMSAQTMTYNKAANLKKNTFTRSGYSFQGWAKSTSGSVAYSNGQSVKNLTRTGGTVKLYAKWKPITYKVTFYPNGGTGSAVTQTMTYNKAANLRSNTFKRTGYTFAGWAKSTTGSVTYSNGQSVKNLSTTNSSVNLYAVWERGVQLWEDGPLWAETNIGAENPEDYGYYFWWGDTIGYKRVNDQWVASDGSSSNFSFTSSNVPTYGKSNSTLQSEGWITSSGVLAPSHDAARAHWGSNWRMPTDCELRSLVDNCTRTWTKKNGVYGYEVRGKGNYSGASIFLPATGYGSGTSLDNAGSIVYFWSSVPYSDDYYYSLALYIYSDYHGMGYSTRPCGHPVRPVSDVH